MEYYVVKTMRLMMYLVRNGHDILKVSDDIENKKYKVFLFKDGVKLRNNIASFKEELNKN